MRIANMSTPTQCSTDVFSKTACGFVVEFVDVITNHVMNSTDTNFGGWPGSEMYNFLNTDIYNTLPNDLQNVIIDTYSVSGHGNNTSSNFTSTEKLYLLSTKEVWGSEGNINSDLDSATNETRQLDYYENNMVTTDSCLAAVKTYQESARSWALRTATSSNGSDFCFVSDSGAWYNTYAHINHGVSPAFRIG